MAGDDRRGPAPVPGRHGMSHSQVLVARCDNYLEAEDKPCTGTLRFRWGMVQAACGACGGWCGIAVANWLTVEGGKL